MQILPSVEDVAMYDALDLKLAIMLKLTVSKSPYVYQEQVISVVKFCTSCMQGGNYSALWRCFY